MNNMIFRNIQTILALGLTLASCQVRDLVQDPLPEKGRHCLRLFSHNPGHAGGSHKGGR